MFICLNFQNKLLLSVWLIICLNSCFFNNNWFSEQWLQLSPVDLMRVLQMRSCRSTNVLEPFILIYVAAGRISIDLRALLSIHTFICRVVVYFLIVSIKVVWFSHHNFNSLRLISYWIRNGAACVHIKWLVFDKLLKHN